MDPEVKLDGHMAAAHLETKMGEGKKRCTVQAGQ